MQFRCEAAHAGPHEFECQWRGDRRTVASDMVAVGMGDKSQRAGASRIQPETLSGQMDSALVSDVDHVARQNCCNPDGVRYVLFAMPGVAA